MGAPTIEDRTLACGSTRGTTVCVTGNSRPGCVVFYKTNLSLSLGERQDEPASVGTVGARSRQSVAVASLWIEILNCLPNRFRFRTRSFLH